MLRTTNNTLRDISRYKNNIAKLAFYHSNDIDFAMDNLSSNLTSSSYSEVILDFDKDINKTTQYLHELQEAVLASNNKHIADDIDLKELFPELKEHGFPIKVMGIYFNKNMHPLDKKEIKSKLLKTTLGKDYENYSAVYKAAKTKKGDDISLPINATKQEKIVFLALKGQENMFFDFAEKINHSLGLYRDLRKQLSNHDLDVLDKGIHGFTRTGIDGIIQQSTHFDSDNIYQISTKHQKDLNHLSVINQIQKLMKEAGITEVEIDPEDSPAKFCRFLEASRDFTLNTTSRFSVKSRKLGNHSRNMDLFGLFMPALKMIAVDSRDPSALVHEFTHAVDFNNSFVSDKMRLQFIDLARNVLNKQYFPNISVFDIANNYDKLINNQNDAYTIAEKIYINDPVSFLAFEQKFEENKDEGILFLSKRLADSTTQNKLIMSAKNAQEKSVIRSGFNLFDTIKPSADFDLGSYIYEIDVSAKHKRNYIKDNRYNILSDYLVENVHKIQQSENHYYNTGNHYLNKSEEIIARAGEIGYILSKYGYDGHKNQEELDEWIDKVREIQTIEKENHGTIRACHSIDTYTSRKEYFGIANASEEFLLSIKNYYKPFFQPKQIYGLTPNGEISLTNNHENLEPVNESKLEHLMKLSRDREFDMYDIKKRLRSQRVNVNKERKSFDKNKNPLAYLKGYDGVAGMIKYNSEHNTLDPRELFEYLIENISDIGKTTLSEKVDIQKVDKRIEVLARLVANKDKFDKQTQSAISAFERANPYETTYTGFNSAINSFFKRTINEPISNIVAYAPKSLKYGINGVDIGIYDYILELAEEIKKNPDYNEQISLADTKELKALAIKRRNNANEGDFNTLNAPSQMIANQESGAMEKLTSLADYFKDKIDSSETKEETLMFYLKSLGSVSMALATNMDDFSKFIDVKEPENSIENHVVQLIKKHLDDLKNNSQNKNEDNHDYEPSYFGNIKYKTNRTILSIGDKDINFDFINDTTKMDIVKRIVDSQNSDGDFELIQIKSKQPKSKKFIESVKNGTIEIDAIHKYLKDLSFNHLEIDFAKEILMNKDSYNDYGMINIALSDNFELIYIASEGINNSDKFPNLDDGTEKRKRRDYIDDFIKFFKKDLYSTSNTEEIYKKLNDPNYAISIAREHLLQKEIEKYSSHHDKDSLTLDEKEKFNSVMFNSFIKPINEALSKKGIDHASYVFDALHDTFNASDSPLYSNKNIKKAFATYLSVLQQNDIIDNPMDHSKNVKDFFDIIKSEDQTEEMNSKRNALSI